MRQGIDAGRLELRHLKPVEISADTESLENKFV